MITLLLQVPVTQYKLGPVGKLQKDTVANIGIMRTMAHHMTRLEMLQVQEV
jgi:hypothetical protein